MTTAARPRLREFAGEAGVREQQVSGNLFVAAGQRALDKTRGRLWDRQVRQAGLEDAGEGRLRPSGNASQVQRLPALRPGEGEVLPLGSVRETPILRRLAGRVARDVGGVKSTQRVRLLQERAGAVRQIEKRVDELDGPEQRALKYVMQLGLPAGYDLAGSVAGLTRRLAQIRRERQQSGFRGTAPVLRDVADDARAIRQILRDPESHLTQRVRDIADELLEIQRRTEAADPDLPAERALIRRDRPQADLLGVERGPDVQHFQGVLDEVEQGLRGGRADAIDQLPPGAARMFAGDLAHLAPDQRPGRARELEAQAGQAARAAGRGYETARRRAAVMRGRVDERERSGEPITTDEIRELRTGLARVSRQVRQLRARRDRLAGEHKGRRAEAEPVKGVRYGPDFRRDALKTELADVRQQLADSERMLKDLRRAVREAGADAPRVTPRMHERLAELEADVNLTRQARASARQLQKLASKVAAAAGRRDTMRLESAEAFDAKVRAAAEAAGLREPAYWMSSPRPQETFSQAAIGTGGRAVAKSRQYTGSLARIGVEETGPDVLTRGVERNIKRRLSWALVARNMDVHAFEWSRGQHGEGLTARELQAEFDARAIDPRSVSLISPRIARRRDLDEAGVERGRLEEDGPDVDEGLDEDAIAEVHDDLVAGTVPLRSMRDVEDLAAADVQGQALNRYLVVPREVAAELEHATRPDGGFARATAILLNQKPARILLGTLNVPWLSFQVASNALLTGIGGKPNPLDIVGAYRFDRWLRNNDPEAHRAWEIEIGVTHGSHMHLDQTRLGSAADKMGSARHLVGFWRAYRHSKVGRTVHKANPLDAMFRADEAQNNMFRKVLFYTQARRDAYKRMGNNWRRIDQAISRVTERVLALPPDHQMAALAAHGPDLERTARRVNDFLGDYLRYSDQERRLLSRNLMFYGYLRFSLRFTFYTMPVEHPVMTAILGNIGRMGAQEIKDLFGVPADYDLPVTMLGSAYVGDRADAKRGTLQQLPLYRLNPALNAITQLEQGQQALGLVSPAFSMLASQAFEEDVFTGRDWRIKGEYPPNESIRPEGYYDDESRGRILLRDVLGLAYPYRAAERMVLEGPQGDDSLLWDPRPTRYKSDEVRRSIRRSVRRERERGTGDRLLGQLLPGMFPQPSFGPQVIDREREKERAARRSGRGRRRRRSGPDYGSRYGGSSRVPQYGGSGSLASRYGG